MRRRRHKQIVRTIPLLGEDSPFQPDPVLAPGLRYDEGSLILFYVAVDEESHVRVTFEGLDSMRAARGEYSPYWSEENDDYSSIAVVQPSPWLKERHEYESAHYGESYEWGRGADTMLVDTHHYLFLFHDGFIEILARGVWFEPRAEPLRQTHEIGPGHPFGVLPPDAQLASGEHDGIRFEVRGSSRPEARLIADARLCSQPLLQLFIDGGSRPDRQVRVRASIDGDAVWADVIGALGVETDRFDHVPTLEEVLPDFRAWVSEVAERRRHLDTG